MVLPLGAAGVQLLNVHRFADDVADRHARIQGCKGILKDNLHLCALFAQLLLIQRGKIPAVK